MKWTLALLGAGLAISPLAISPAAAQSLTAPRSFDHAAPRDPAMTLTGSVTARDGGAVRSSADGSGAELRLVFNNLHAPGQERPAVAPAAWVYLFLPPGLTVDARYTPPGVYTAPIGAWTLLYVFQPALSPCGGHQWTIPLLSGADEPGEIFAFRRGRWGWAPAPGTQDVGALPAAGH